MAGLVPAIHTLLLFPGNKRWMPGPRPGVTVEKSGRLMFKTVLIANRGEIACRIARTAKRLGMRTIAVYSEADAMRLHVKLADEAHLIGPARRGESYLVAGQTDRRARKRARADCIHPGYGFLSENAAFAEACARRRPGVRRPAAGRHPGDGPQGPRQGADGEGRRAGGAGLSRRQCRSRASSSEKAYEIGYPVLIKAVAGGGGKGMRRVDRHAEFDAALEGARARRKRSFGDARADREVRRRAAPYRDADFRRQPRQRHSSQRARLFAAAPPPEGDRGSAGARHERAALRAAMGEAAVGGARAVGYVGAGTVEFIADGARGLKRGGFWFMEMNTRLQVEHPVTEADHRPRSGRMAVPRSPPARSCR